MKKAAALFLVILFSFNLCGYMLVVEYLQHRATTELESKLDKNLYDDSRLIEIKIPVNMPYQTGWSVYERYDGEMEIGGMFYKYVKRKLSGDTLYLLCIPHTKKTHLENERNNYFALSNDLGKSRDSKTSKISIKNLLDDYDVNSFSANISPVAEYKVNSWPENDGMRLPLSFASSTEHPPEFAL